MSELTLYIVKGACSLVPHALLEHLGIPYNIIDMVITPEGCAAADASMSAAQYRTIHPLGSVPALQLASGDVITENAAILAYINSLAPENTMFGRSPLEYAQVIQWFSLLSGGLHAQAFGALLRPERFTDSEACLDAVRTKGKIRVGEYFALMDRQLEGKKYAVGEALTAADFYMTVFFYWARRNRLDMDGKYANYKRIIKTVESTGAWRTTMAEEGITLAFA
ncbi:uncharacterized protein F5Z01DRAFT_477519 [Emericellopsis atlantica]|uniref:Glutathione S-transferase n=1 Tax=Emericellopsis atlantica TaxID=2614577 RepID=A0A9P8CT86_9HYPO|nr:uncharacterized protein F5Z01DRAFT_477519 [Emericellopsis atlantica]KAG9256561.1 hypothetical protein F5Z01DRAFT_477519 [Emericellopsis atlantica]